VTRTSSERLADIGAAAERVSRAVEAMERAEADGSEDEAQLAFDALLYRLVVIGEAVKALPADLLARQPQIRGASSRGCVTCSLIITTA
jgi:uncharacterized protein with HEPN domain